jgi:hypothetical protein
MTATIIFLSLTDELLGPLHTHLFTIRSTVRDGFLHREDGVKVYETLNFEVQDLLVCDNARTRQEICPCVITLIEAYSI